MQQWTNPCLPYRSSSSNLLLEGFLLPSPGAPFAKLHLQEACTNDRFLIHTTHHRRCNCTLCDLLLLKETFLGKCLQNHLSPQGFILEVGQAYLWRESTCCFPLFSLDGSMGAKHFKGAKAKMCQRMSVTNDTMCLPDFVPVPYTLNKICIWNFLHLVCQVHIVFTLWVTTFLCDLKGCHSISPWEPRSVALFERTGGWRVGKRGANLPEPAWKKLDKN